MSLKKAIHDYSRYNHWANKKTIQWLQGLDPELFYRKTESSFASIELTLQHMKNAQDFWQRIIVEPDIIEAEQTLRVNVNRTIFEEFLQGSQRMVDTCTAFSNEELLIKVTSPVMLETRADFIFHVINHNAYHRGQIVSIARFLGISESIPGTGYEDFLWSEQGRCEP